MTKDEFYKLLTESGVMNQFTHWEDGLPITFITSMQEVEDLVEAVLQRGRSETLEGGV